MTYYRESPAVQSFGNAQKTFRFSFKWFPRTTRHRVCDLFYGSCVADIRRGFPFAVFGLFTPFLFRNKTKKFCRTNDGRAIAVRPYGVFSRNTLINALNLQPLNLYTQVSFTQRKHPAGGATEVAGLWLPPKIVFSKFGFHVFQASSTTEPDCTVDFYSMTVFVSRLRYRYV